MNKLKAFRAAIFYMLDNPLRHQNVADSYQYFEDGVLLLEDGKVKKAGSCRRNSGRSARGGRDRLLP